MHRMWTVVIDVPSVSFFLSCGFTWLRCDNMVECIEVLLWWRLGDLKNIVS